MDQGNVSSTCKKLENKGWLERKRSEKDERVVMVSLSEKGKTILSQIEQYAYIIGIISGLIWIIVGLGTSAGKFAKSIFDEI